MTNAEKIHKQMISLFPEDSRAFKVPVGSDLWRLLRALSLGYGRIEDASDNILDALIPDNGNFTEEDAAIWERIFGMSPESGVTLENRKLAIHRKMAHPGEQPARQHYLFIQEQLRAAGFDVYVYENRFFPGPVTKTPGEVLGIDAGLAIYGSIAYGEAEYGATWADDGITIIANKLNAAVDASFGIGANYRSTFFISGNPITTFAEVEAIRETELRELILKLKPVPTIGFLFVNYI